MGTYLQMEFLNTENNPKSVEGLSNGTVYYGQSLFLCKEVDYELSKAERQH